MNRVAAGIRQKMKWWGNRVGSKTMLGGTALALAGLATSTIANARGETQPVPAAVPAPAPASDPLTPAPPPPPPAWTAADAGALVNYLSSLGSEGLNPLDYDLAGLVAAIRSGKQGAINAAATDRFERAARDLSLGRIDRAARVDWHVVDNDLPDARVNSLLAEALTGHRVAETLAGLLPSHPQYASLRNALAAARQDPSRAGEIDGIRLNMDRWRWLPRELGDKYIIVNVPAFHATLVEDGKVRWKERAIAGAMKTPTPMLSTMASGVVINPWWEVPQSINREVAGKAGFVPVKKEDGSVLRWRQPPGPSNALGVMKFVMANPWAIYLHDTNARSRFNDQVRALSHGCIRTQHITDLATELLSDDGGAWDAAKLDETVRSKKTVTAKFVNPVPVYIVYFSKAATVDGGIVDYSDVYKRDAAMIAALKANDRGAGVARTAAKAASAATKSVASTATASASAAAPKAKPVAAAQAPVAPAPTPVRDPLAATPPVVAATPVASGGKVSVSTQTTAR